MEEVRHECGRLMGEQDTTEVDCACGIPDSGIGMAVGYANGHKLYLAASKIDAEELGEDRVITNMVRIKSVLKVIGIKKAA